MKLIKPSYKILNQPPGLQGIYEQIELAGRTCYASSHKIQYQENNTCNGFISTTAKDFVDRMINSKHYAMLEHGTVYLKIKSTIITNELLRTEDFKAISEYKRNPYSKVVDTGGYAYITTNMRVLQENGWLNDLKYLCEPTEFHEKRVTVRFTTSNGIMREFTRHRSHSFAVESTRYCNYSKEKFNNELTFIIPSWMDIEEGRITTDSFGCPTIVNEETYDFLSGLGASERSYFRLINRGWKPQQAREVLPLATKCDMVMTGFVSDWRHFFRLRTSILAETGKPHPDAAALADPLYKEFIKRDYK